MVQPAVKERVRTDTRAESAARLLDIPYCPQHPLKPEPNRKQARFLLDFSLEVLFGGAAGPGKSSALLMAALQFIDVPGYAALILRKSYADLTKPGALLDRAHSWFGLTDARWSAQTHTWHFPSGASISFGYLDGPNDKYNYQSAEYQYIAFDELTQFREGDYRFLFSRLRKPENLGDGMPLSRVPLRMRAASNPGGRGHEWVKRRFIDSKSADRRFHAARLIDNPYVNHDTYLHALAQLDPVTRAQLEKGDWDIREAGNLFKRQWFPIHEVPVPGKKTVRYWDLAASVDGDYTAGAKMTRLAEGTTVIEHIIRQQATPQAVEQLVRATALHDGPEVAVHIEQEPGASGKSLMSHYRRNVLPEFEVRSHAKQTNKITAAKLWSSRAERGEVAVVRGAWVDAFFDEIELFPDGDHDDMTDAVSGAYAVLAGRERVRLIV